MQSQTTNVSDYIAEASTERQPALQILREMCQKTLQNFEEKIMYGMPSYTKNDMLQVSFANQKNYITVYLPNDTFIPKYQKNIKNLGKTVSTGKTCIKFSKPEIIDFLFLQEILQEIIENVDNL